MPGVETFLICSLKIYPTGSRRNFEFYFNTFIIAIRIEPPKPLRHNRLLTDTTWVTVSGMRSFRANLGRLIISCLILLGLVGAVTHQAQFSTNTNHSEDACQICITAHALGSALLAVSISLALGVLVLQAQEVQATGIITSLQQRKYRFTSRGDPPVFV